MLTGDQAMSVSLWVVDPSGVHEAGISRPSLDALSLELPDGAYTTMRTYGGQRVVGLSRHLERLAASLAELGAERTLDLPVLRRAIARVIATEARPDVRLRVTVPLVGNQVLIASEPWQHYPPELYTGGVRCATTTLERDHPLAKTTTFIRPSRTAKEQTDPAIHELLRVDRDGLLLEGTTSNFFGQLDGTLRTADRDVLAGVTRGVVLALAAELVPVRFEPIHLRELGRLSEAFITSSTREVVPVVAIDATPIGDGRPGPISRELLARYRAGLEAAAEVP